MENFFAYGLIGILQKAVPFVMLPVITRLLANTADYGMVDMYSALVELGGNIATFGLYDAVFREYFEREDVLYKKSILSSALGLELSLIHI